MKSEVWLFRAAARRSGYKYIVVNCRQINCKEQRVIRWDWAQYLKGWAVILWSSAGICFQRFPCQGTSTELYKNNPLISLIIQLSKLPITAKSFYLMFLSSKNLVRYFWMMWSAKSHSGIRFSDCLSFSKDLTWRHKITLTCAVVYNRSMIVSYRNSLESIVICRASQRFCTVIHLHIASLLVGD